MQRVHQTAITGALAACITGCGIEPADPDIANVEHRSDDQRDCTWEQWGGNPEHQGMACREVRNFDRISAQVTFDPFVAEEQADARLQRGLDALLTHFQSPLLVDDHIYMEFKSGQYTSCAEVELGQPCGILTWNSQIWQERAFHWRNGELVHDWTFESDWKPAPGAFAFWEPMFHAAVVGAFLYVPGASGSLHKLDRRTGRKLTTITLPGADPNTFVAGGLATDDRGNLFYNVLAVDPVNPRANPRGAWLVKVRPNNTVVMAPFSTIVTGAPAPTDPCFTQFPASQRPWPPSPDALPPSRACGLQRPPLNVTPAIRDDGTVVTISRAHFEDRYTYVVAVDSDLRPVWTTSLRGHLNDGCGVFVPIDAPADTTDPILLTHCREGARFGVELATNLPPAAGALDIVSSSPVILPDGGVLYGAFTDYNDFRSKLFKFDRHGRYQANYDSGWDVTPTVYRHHGTYSIIVKDSDNVPNFFMTQLDSQLRPEWTFQATNTQSCRRDANGEVICVEDPAHPSGFEWCVNAAAVDPEGNVYANNADGWVYKIGQGGRLLERTFLLQALGAAYTPIAIDKRGRLVSLNGGDMFVIGGDRH